MCVPFSWRGLESSVALAILAGSFSSGYGADGSGRMGQNDQVLVLEAFEVRTGPIENFGFQLASSFPPEREKKGGPLGIRPLVVAVIPNTAASKAGLRPGDTIHGSDGNPVLRNLITTESILPDGKRVTSGLRWENEPWPWEGFYIPPEKQAAIQAGHPVTWTLEVKSHDHESMMRTVILTLPTPPPRWEAKVWSAPEGRISAPISEIGPLAERARMVWDNGVWVMLREELANSALLRRSYYYCYQWWIGTSRSFSVSRIRGRTDIILQHGTMYYLTSPAGMLERAVRYQLVPRANAMPEIPTAEAQKAFQQEVDFWLNKVGKVSERWPLELIP